MKGACLKYLNDSCIYLQSRYWKSSDRRWGYADDLHEDMKCIKNNETWHKYALPNNSASIPVKQTQQAKPLTFPDGWELIDEKFFEARERQPLTEETFVRYFDGATPSWNREFLRALPKRDRIDESLAFIKQSQENKISSMLLILGAGGEGKSTALHQIALELYNEGLQVILHTGTQPLPINFLLELPDDKTWRIS